MQSATAGTSRAKFCLRSLPLFFFGYGPLKLRPTHEKTKRDDGYLLGEGLCRAAIKSFVF